MIPRITLALLAMAGLAWACGPRARSAEPEHGDVVVARPGSPIASALDVKVADGIQFGFRITNTASGKVELLFPSGQTHEFVVIDSLGREVWRWSEGRLFTQALQNKVLASAETLTYEADWNPGKLQGRYTAVASLMSKNHPLEQRVEFAVP